MQPGVPESFNVLVRELQSLCLDVELIKAGHGSRSRLRLTNSGKSPTKPKDGLSGHPQSLF